MRIQAMVCGLSAVAVLSSSGRADVITDWGDIYVDAIRETGGKPGPIARVGAIMTLAMYDAVNGIALANGGFGYSPYQTNLPAPTDGASKKAAAAAAAHHVMTMMYGSGAANPNASLQAMFDAQFAANLRGVNADAANAGIAYGNAVASSLIALRAGDGWDADDSYTFGGNPGDWMITPDGLDGPAYTPQWGDVSPFGLQAGNQFRPTRFQDMFGMSMDTMMHSAEYAEQINGGPNVFGVKDWGARDSFLRTEDQTEMAWFWANDRDGTSKPPGQMMQITNAVSQQEGLSMMENARLYALVGMALGDAAIAAWDAKYDSEIDLWRPISAIRETLDDGNDLTMPVADWLPLNDFTPPFPAYVSGHATFSAAHAAVMAAFFGTDNISFTIGSDEFIVNPDLGYPGDLTRTFSSFSEAAWENAMSRVFLGVHFQWDAEDGNALGYDVGNYIFDNYFQPIPAPPAMLALALGLPLLGRRRRA